jgi:anti-anti-sigma factor
MSLTKTILDNNRGILLKISGRFDVGLQQAFREAYRDTAVVGMTYRVDLSQVTYIDSAALWLLASLAEYAKDHDALVKIINPSSVAKRSIAAASMSELLGLTI